WRGSITGCRIKAICRTTASKKGAALAGLLFLVAVGCYRQSPERRGAISSGSALAMTGLGSGPDTEFGQGFSPGVQHAFFGGLVLRNRGSAPLRIMKVEALDVSDGLIIENFKLSLLKETGGQAIGADCGTAPR